MGYYCLLKNKELSRLTNGFNINFLRGIQNKNRKLLANAGVLPVSRDNTSPSSDQILISTNQFRFFDG